MKRMLLLLTTMLMLSLPSMAFACSCGMEGCDANSEACNCEDCPMMATEKDAAVKQGAGPFNKADINKDGVLSRDEFKAVRPGARENCPCRDDD